MISFAKEQKGKKPARIAQVRRDRMIMKETSDGKKDKIKIPMVTIVRNFFGMSKWMIL